MAPSGHALLAPSAAHRWLVCPGSVPFGLQFPDGDSSVYAEEGTLAHAAAECILREDKAGLDSVKRKILAGNFDPEIPEKVKKYTDYVCALRDSVHGELFVEQRLSLKAITGEEGARGTSDAVILADGELYIIDLKYGQGDKIDAPENPQLLIYAGAAYQAFSFADIEKITVAIVQPRLDHVSEWSMPLAELLSRLDDVRKKAAEALLMKDLEPENWRLEPGLKQCRYCKARGSCRALAEACLSAAGMDILEKSKTPRLVSAEIGRILSQLPLIEKWADTMRETAIAEILAGREVPGWKLVAGREGPRKWADEKAAEKLLSGWKIPAASRYVKKLISPTGAESLQKGGMITSGQYAELLPLITRSPAKPALAPADDKRPEFRQTSAADYPDESLQPGAVSAGESVKTETKENENGKN